MRETARFALEDGGDVVVEVGHVPNTARVARGDGAVTDAKATFEEALGSIRDAGSAVLGRLRSMARQPDEVELKFAVKLSATAGAVIAKTAVGGQFEVKLKWLGDPAAVVGPEEPDTHTAKPDPAA